MAHFQKSLRFYNLLVAAVHSTSFVALLIINIVYYNNTRRSRNFFLDAPEREFGNYLLMYTLLPFPFITAIFHLLAAYNFSNYYYDVLVRSVAPLRWVEYTITNGLMTFSLCALVGFTGTPQILNLLLANATMQSFGYAHEVANSKRSVHLFFLIIGFVPWFYKWALKLIYFNSQESAGYQVFLYDYFAVYGALFWSLTFVAPLVYRYVTYDPKRTDAMRVNYNTEVAYLFLSLSAKLWLDWTITIGNLVEQ